MDGSLCESQVTAKADPWYRLQVCSFHQCILSGCQPDAPLFFWSMLNAEESRSDSHVPSPYGLVLFWFQPVCSVLTDSASTVERGIDEMSRYL